MDKELSIQFIPPKPGTKLGCVQVTGHPVPACNRKHWVTDAKRKAMIKAVVSDDPVSAIAKWTAKVKATKRKAA